MSATTLRKRLRALTLAAALGAAVVLTGCAGTDPIHIKSGHAAQPVRNRNVANAPCAIQWQDIVDARTLKDPIGYIVAKPIHYPDFFTDFDNRLRSLAADKSAPNPTALRVELLRAYIEQRLTTVAFSMSVRVQYPDGMPKVLATGVSRSIMIGDNSEGMRFVQIAMDESMVQLARQLAPFCALGPP